MSEFRARLLEGGLEQLLLDKLLEHCQQRGWLKARGRQRTGSRHVGGAVKVLNQLELVGETLRQARNVLATVAPDWLKQQAKSEWYERYGERIEDYRLPKDKTERERHPHQDQADGQPRLLPQQDAQFASLPDPLRQDPAQLELMPTARGEPGAAEEAHHKKPLVFPVTPCQAAEPLLTEEA